MRRPRSSRQPSLRWRRSLPDGKKRGNAVALLSTLHEITWPDSGWKEVSFTQLMNGAGVRKAYFNACRKLYPDKLPADAPAMQVALSTEIAFILNNAWEKYKSDNGM